MVANPRFGLLGLLWLRVSVRCLIIVVALTSVCIWWALRVSERLPDDWDAREFEAAVRDVVDLHGRATVTVELLAWSTQEDDRPLLVDAALAWARIEDQNQVRWALLELYRHPRDSPEWHLSRLSHGPDPVKYFNRQPSNSDIYRFDDGVFGGILKAAWGGFHTLNSRVRYRTWFRSVGQIPTRFPS